MIGSKFIRPVLVLVLACVGTAARPGPSYALFGSPDPPGPLDGDPGAMTTPIPADAVPQVYAVDRTGRVVVLGQPGHGTLYRLDRLTGAITALPPAIGMSATGDAVITPDHRWRDLRTGDSAPAPSGAYEQYTFADDGRTYLFTEYDDSFNPTGWIVDASSGSRLPQPIGGRPFSISRNGRFILLDTCRPRTTDACRGVWRWDRQTGRTLYVGAASSVADNGRLIAKDATNESDLVELDGSRTRLPLRPLEDGALSGDGNVAVVGNRYTSCCAYGALLTIATSERRALGDWLTYDNEISALAFYGGALSGDGSTWVFPRSTSLHDAGTPIVAEVTALRLPSTEPVARLRAAEVLPVPVAGRGGVDATAATVLLNVTVTAPATSGFVTVWPCGSPQPLASTLNFVAGQTVANSALVKVGTNGTVCTAGNAATNVVVDATGWLPDASDYHGITPVRLVDTRNGETDTMGNIPSGTIASIPVAPIAGVGGPASAVMLNVTVTNPSGPGFVTVWPCGEPRPVASNVNFTAGETRPNAVLTKVGSGGAVCAYSNATVDLVVDGQGWLPESSTYRPVTPLRLVDTRNGEGDTTPNTPAGTSVTVAAPVGAAAVALNVTVTNPSTAGYLVVWPCDQPRPVTSTLNFASGQTVANAVITGVGPSGTICAESNVSTDVIADLVGTFVAGSTFRALTPSRILDTRV